jgi:hypothetical protein
MITTLIGVGSRARIGKDYAAKELAKYFDLERVAFADALKLDVAQLFKAHGLDYWGIEGEPALKEKVRPLLVEYGMTMRKFNEDAWIDRALNKEFTHEVTFVTDVRFPNEAKRIKALGGHYIEIQTDLPPANETEAYYSPLMKGLADYTVKNNFDSHFIQDMVKLIGSLNNTAGSPTWKRTQSNESNIIHSTDIAISFGTSIQKQ